MSKTLNNTNWGKFEIKDLFETFTGTNGLQTPTGSYINKRDLRSGDTPRITVTDTNNGIDSFLFSEDRNYRVFENFISISFLGSVFYHPYKASLDMKVHALLLKDYKLNKCIAEFIKIAIKMNTSVSSYGNQLSSTDLPNLKIVIPVIGDNKPDYEYMEQYMKAVEQKQIAAYKKYLEIRTNEDIILSSENTKWKEFKIRELFEYISRGKRLIKSKHIDGRTPYISSTMLDNGVDGFIDNKNGKYFENCITLANSGSVGSSFYQKYKFIGSDHITALKNEKYNRYIYLYITNMLLRLKEKYSFNREITDKRIMKETILLPVNKNGELNYEYMEQYMKNIEYKQLMKYVAYLLMEKE